jgi:hypothetical protein
LICGSGPTGKQVLTSKDPQIPVTKQIVSFKQRINKSSKMLAVHIEGLQKTPAMI